MRALLPLLLVLVLCLTPAARADVAADLKSFLGGRGGKIVARDRALGDKLYLFDIDSGQLSKVSDDLDCRAPLISPDGTQLTWFQDDAIYVQDLGSSTKKKVATGYDPHWWIDSSSDTWIYYTSAGSFSSSSRKLWWPNNNGVKTYRIRLKDDKTEELWDWKGSGGPSPDGKYIGAGYATMILYDTAATKAHLLYDQTQGCNASMYPGSGKYLLMHLELPHDTFCYRDASDNRVWYALKPAGTEEWQNPEWSSDVDYATATAKETNTYYSTWVVKLSEIDGATGKIKSGSKGMLKVLETAGGHDWAEPYLWVAPPPAPDSGPPPADSGPPAMDGDPGVTADAGGADASVTKADALQPTEGGTAAGMQTLAGGCALSPRGRQPGGLPAAVLLVLLLALRRRRG